MVKNCRDIGENLQLITKRLIANQTLCKLCYYTDKDPLGHEDLSEEMRRSFLHKFFKIIPRLEPEEISNSYIAVVVNDGTGDSQNSEFRNVKILIYVYVPLLQWVIKSDNLRPFLIMGAIQESLRDKKINGLGTLRGGDFVLNNLTEDMSCYVMEFNITNYV